MEQFNNHEAFTSHSAALYHVQSTMHYIICRNYYNPHTPAHAVSTHPLHTVVVTACCVQYVHTYIQLTETCQKHVTVVRTGVLSPLTVGAVIERSFIASAGDIIQPNLSTTIAVVVGI